MEAMLFLCDCFLEEVKKKPAMQKRHWYKRRVCGIQENYSYSHQGLDTLDEK